MGKTTYFFYVKLIVDSVMSLAVYSHNHYYTFYTFHILPATCCICINAVKMVVETKIVQKLIPSCQSVYILSFCFISNY